MTDTPETFYVLVRAMRHLTATVRVTAPTKDEARRRALIIATGPAFAWDESDPEDVQVEGFE